MSTYEKYVKDEEFLGYYNEYQRRYADQMAERDKVFLRLIAEQTSGKGSLLDIGCSTGNLLKHIRRAFPDMTLTGGELAESSLTEARANSDLAGVAFRTMDMLAIEGRYDCIVANAVAVYFDWPEYTAALNSIAKALNPGGVYMAFEWLHPFDQTVRVIEECQSHPDGLMIYARPYRRVEPIARDAGFATVDFQPFVMPFDLPFPGYDSDTFSYTVPNGDTGERMAFRGTIYQPWCHMTARRAG